MGGCEPVALLDKPFGVTGLPTHFGSVAYRYDPQARTVTVSVERPAPGGIRSAFPGDVRVVVQ